MKTCPKTVCLIALTWIATLAGLLSLSPQFSGRMSSNDKTTQAENYDRDAEEDFYRAMRNWQ